MKNKYKKIAEFLKKQTEDCKYVIEDGVYYMICDNEKIPVDYVRFENLI